MIPSGDPVADLLGRLLTAPVAALVVAPVGAPVAAERPRLPHPVVGCCGCGCGVAVRKRFLPGHDSRLKARLLDVARRGSWVESERAAWWMVDAGWGRFIDEAILHGLPTRQVLGRRKLHVDQVLVWLVAPSGQHHCDASCKSLTAEAKAQFQIHPITRLARPSFVERRVATPAIADHLRRSWDRCVDCTVEETALEQVERTRVLQWLTLDALDQESGVDPGPLRVAQRVLANQPWVVEPDCDAEGNVLPVQEAA